jgi:hypothetical protein
MLGDFDENSHKLEILSFGITISNPRAKNSRDSEIPMIKHSLKYRRHEHGTQPQLNFIPEYKIQFIPVH